MGPRQTLLYETLRCLAAFALCVLPCAAVLLPVRYRTKTPDFVFRKLMHLAALLGVTAMLLRAAGWQCAATACCAAAAAAWPALSLLERAPWYAGLLVEKRPGEVRRSLCLHFLTVAALAALAWGALGRGDIAAASVLMWGVGDAAAALVGVPFGRHKVRWRLADKNKSWEGTLAMFAAALLAGFAALLFLSGAGVLQSLLFAAAGAAAAAGAELVSKRGADTVAAPLAAAAALCLLSLI